MDIFPISLKLQQQRCLIVGGGHIALRKATLLAKAGAIIDIVAPEIEEQLLQLVTTQMVSILLKSSLRNF